MDQRVPQNIMGQRDESMDQFVPYDIMGQRNECMDQIVPQDGYDELRRGWKRSLVSGKAGEKNTWFCQCVKSEKES